MTPQPPIAVTPRPPIAVTPQPPITLTMSQQPIAVAAPQQPVALAAPQQPVAAAPQQPVVAAPQPPIAAAPQPPIAVTPQPLPAPSRPAEPVGDPARSFFTCAHEQGDRRSDGSAAPPDQDAAARGARLREGVDSRGSSEEGGTGRQNLPWEARLSGTGRCAPCARASPSAGPDPRGATPLITRNLHRTYNLVDSLLTAC